MKRLGAVLLAVCMAAVLAGCGGGKSSGSEGRTGETMETYFFDFTVNSARLISTYETYTPAEGNVMLVVDVTVKNTFQESIEMYDTDFWLEWGEEDVYVDAITTDPETYEELDPIGENQLPGTYQLAINEERTGELVFEVPGDKTDFSIWSLEQFDDGTEEGDTGDFYYVYFTAEDQTA